MAFRLQYIGDQFSHVFVVVNDQDHGGLGGRHGNDLITGSDIERPAIAAMQVADHGSDALQPKQHRRTSRNQMVVSIGLGVSAGAALAAQSSWGASGLVEMLCFGVIEMGFRSRLTVLVVEDDVLHMELVRETLEEFGMSVIKALSTDEAWWILHSDRKIDLALLEVSMRGSMSGSELARRVHARY